MTKNNKKIVSMHKKLWISGSNYVTSLPRDWAKKIKEEYSEIQMIQIGDKITVKPPYNPYEKRKVKISLNSTSVYEILNKVIAAYVNGYDEVELNIDELSDEAKTLIKKRLPIALLNRDVDGGYKIIFPETKESLKDFMTEYTKLINAMYEKTLDSFNNFPDLETIRKNKNIVREFKNRIYLIDIQVRRILSNIYFHPELIENIGIDINSEKDVLDIAKIIEQYKQIADLHENINEILESISTSNIIKEIGLFSEYYKNVYETISIAINSFNKPENCLKVIAGEDSDWQEYNGGVLKNSQETIDNYIEHIISSIKDFDVIKNLVLLKENLSAILKIASYLCKLNYNLQAHSFIEPMDK